MRSLFICLFLFITILNYAQDNSKCNQSKSIQKEVNGLSSFTFQPTLSDNGCALTGYVSWKFKWIQDCWRLIGDISYVPGNDVVIDGERYTASEIGKDVLNRMEISRDPVTQKGLLYYDIYSGSKFLKTVSVRCNNYVRQGMDNTFCWSEITNSFSEEQICDLVNNGFTVKISKVEGLVFSSCDEVKLKVRELKNSRIYDEKVKVADALFNKKRWEESKEAYIEAYKSKKEKYANDQIEQINVILKKEAEQKRLEEAAKNKPEISLTVEDSEQKTKVSDENQEEKSDTTNKAKTSGYVGDPYLTNSSNDGMTIAERDKKRLEIESENEYLRRKAEIDKDRAKFRDDVVNSINSSTSIIISYSKSYQQFKAAINDNISLPQTSDPEELLEAYQNQTEKLNTIYKDKMAELNAQMNKITSSSSESQTIQQNTENLTGIISNMAAENKAGKAISDAKAQLRSELETSFNNIKAEIINTNTGLFNQFSQLASVKFNIDEENYYLSQAEFYFCIVDYTKKNFSYENTSWIRNNCKRHGPQAFGIDNYIPTDKELYETALRKKSYIEYFPGFQKAANDYIDMAIKLNPYNSDYYYLKSTITTDNKVKEACLRNTLLLNPNNQKANDDLIWKQYSDSVNGGSTYLQRQKSLRSYLNVFPNGNHVVAAKNQLDLYNKLIDIQNLFQDGRSQEAFKQMEPLKIDNPKHYNYLKLSNESNVYNEARKTKESAFASMQLSDQKILLQTSKNKFDFYKQKYLISEITGQPIDSNCAYCLQTKNDVKQIKREYRSKFAQYTLLLYPYDKMSQLSFVTSGFRKKQDGIKQSWYPYLHFRKSFKNSTSIGNTINTLSSVSENVYGDSIFWTNEIKERYKKNIWHSTIGFSSSFINKIPISFYGALGVDIYGNMSNIIRHPFYVDGSSAMNGSASISEGNWYYEKVNYRIAYDFGFIYLIRPLTISLGISSPDFKPMISFGFAIPSMK